jgi:hypothetical protein
MATLGYPLTTENGRLSTVTDLPTCIHLCILSAIRTYKTERIARNRYGIEDRLFTPSTDVSEGLADIYEAIALSLEALRSRGWRSRGDAPYLALPPVRYQVSGLYTDDGFLSVRVGYTVGNRDGIVEETL